QRAVMLAVRRPRGAGRRRAGDRGHVDERSPRFHQFPRSQPTPTATAAARRGLAKLASAPTTETRTRLAKASTRNDPNTWTFGAAANLDPTRTIAPPPASTPVWSTPPSRRYGATNGPSRSCHGPDRQPALARTTPATNDASSGRPAWRVGTSQTPSVPTTSKRDSGSVTSASHVPVSGSAASSPFAPPSATEIVTGGRGGGDAGGGIAAAIAAGALGAGAAAGCAVEASAGASAASSAIASATMR